MPRAPRRESSRMTTRFANVVSAIGSNREPLDRDGQVSHIDRNRRVSLAARRYVPAARRPWGVAPRGFASY
ncbi:hypothetical protein PT2222_330020 [Paraburkholderia tropica]